MSELYQETTNGVCLVSRAQSQRNPWVQLTSALLSRCWGAEVQDELGQQVVAMVRSLYNTKHKLPAQVHAHTHHTHV